MPNGTATLTLENYASDAKAWVAGAQQLADEKSHEEVDPLHLLAYGLERDPGVAAVFQKAGAGPRDLQSSTERALARIPKVEGQAFLSDALLELLKRAERESRGDKARKVEVEDLLNALTQEVRGPVAEVLGAFNLGPGALRGQMDALRSVPRPQIISMPSGIGELVTDLVEAAREGRLDPVIGRQHEIRRALTILERRQKGHPVLVGEPGVGRGAIVRGLAMRIASGDVPTSLAELRLLEVDVGALSAGTRLRGETEARMRKLIDSSLRGEEPGAIFVIRSVTRLLGTSAVAPALGNLFTSAFARGRLRLLATTTPEGWRNIESNEPSLARELTALAVEPPSPEEAQAIVRGVAGRYEKHHRVRVSEGAVQASVSLARRYLSDRFLPDSALDLLDETAAACRVETDGISAAVDAQRSELSSLQAQRDSLAGLDDDKSKKKLNELGQRIAELEPEVEKQRTTIESRRGAVAALRTLSKELAEAEAARDAAKAEKDYARLGELEHVTIPDLKARLQKAEQSVGSAGIEEPGPAQIDEAQIASTLAEWTGIPVAKMLEEEAEKLVKMEERLGQRVIGQMDAVTAIAKAIRRGRVGLRDPRRPIGSFLFLGTSGVGKTELAKALAEFLFDDENALTRLDMSEFMERHMAQRLLGAPPGYADSEKGGFLTEAVRKRPYSVLLFDEVEKAHQDVFNLLLQVLDDGRLTDGRGRLADFTNTVVIMTSNIGSERLIDTPQKVFESEEGKEALRDVLFERLHEFFRPEFLNRIGDTVVFRPLSKPDLRQIVDLQLGSVQRLLQRRELELEVDDAAKDRLVELGYEPALGARPLQRVIIRHLQDPLAEELLKGGYRAGQKIRVTLEGEDFRFQSS